MVAAAAAAPMLLGGWVVFVMLRRRFRTSILLIFAVNPRSFIFSILIAPLVSCDRTDQHAAVLESSVSAKSEISLLPVTKGEV
jgi:hypothetical protein